MPRRARTRTALAAALTVALAAGAWLPPTRTPSTTSSPEPLLRARFPGVTRVPGSVLNAVVDFLRPVAAAGGGAGQQPYIARRRRLEEDGGGEGGARARELQAPPPQPYLTCAAAAGAASNATATVTAATGPWHVSGWCFLAHLQPHVAAALAGLRGVTLFVPSDAAFARLLAWFPAFYEWCVRRAGWSGVGVWWRPSRVDLAGCHSPACARPPHTSRGARRLAAFPSCVAGFNRAEYFLLAHAVRGNASCAGVRCTDRGAGGPYRAFAAGGAEAVALGLVVPPGQRVTVEWRRWERRRRGGGVTRTAGTFLPPVSHQRSARVALVPRSLLQDVRAGGRRELPGGPPRVPGVG
jgi:hypothetical protein